MATKVIGLDRLKRKLKQFPETVKAEIKLAMEQGADEIVNMMKSLCPSDTIRATIGWTWGAAPTGSMSLGTVRAKGQGNLAVTIFAGDQSTMVGSRLQFQLAMLLEFGTAPHTNGGKFAGSEHPGTKAQPFFFVSYRALRKRAKGRVTRAVNKAAKRMATGG